MSSRKRYSNQEKLKHLLGSYITGVGSYCNQPGRPSRKSLYRWREVFANNSFEQPLRKK
jgi:hypothetical protein